MNLYTTTIEEKAVFILHRLHKIILERGVDEVTLKKHNIDHNKTVLLIESYNNLKTYNIKNDDMFEFINGLYLNIKNAVKPHESRNVTVKLR